MKGIIKECRGAPDPNCYIIEDDDGKEYFAHIGDLRKNEKIIERSHDAEILHQGDKVEFEIFDASTRQTAYHVKKVN